MCVVFHVGVLTRLQVAAIYRYSQISAKLIPLGLVLLLIVILNFYIEILLVILSMLLLLFHEFQILVLEIALVLDL